MRLYFFVLFLFLSSYAFAADDDLYEIPEDDTPISLFLGDLAESIFKDPDDVTTLSAIDPLNPVLSAECEPLTSVGGCVNVISGGFFQIEKDLVGNTIEPMSLIRFYDSGNTSESSLGFGFGSQYPLWASDVEKGARHHYGLISERESFFLLYRDKEEGIGKLCFIDPRLLQKGYTNLNRASVSGRANFVNWRAFFRSGEDSEKWIVRLGDGTKRIYDKHVSLSKEQRSRMQFPTKSGYLLTKEIKPNGNRLEFSYRFLNGKHRLTQIDSLNRKKELLNSLTFHYQAHQCLVKDSYRNCVSYQFEDKPRFYVSRFYEGVAQRKFLIETESSQQGATHYEMTEGTWKISQLLKPEDRLVKIDYYPSGKVKTLSQCLGTKEPINRYTFHYHHNHTEVFDALDQLTTYAIDDHQRISKINYFDGKHPIRQDCFEWSTKEGEEGWLRSKSIRSGNEIHYLKTYRYDSRGNVISEALYGNLTGEKPETFTLSQKREMDRTFITYDYYPNRRNLLKETQTADGLTLSYEYAPRTNLCTKTLSRYAGSIQERSFREYDDNGELKTLIEDDGSNEQETSLDDVKFRKVQRITAVAAKGAAFGKPEKISEYYQDQTGKEILLNETTLSYDEKGCEIARVLFDPTTSLNHTTTKTYDERLLLRSETNPLGHTIRYEYDNNRNKILEELIGSGKKVEHTYDFGNRLTAKSEIHDDGKNFITKYVYDSLDQLIEEIDPYGNKTTYTYDRIGNPTQCVKPAIQDGNDGVISPTVSRKYNSLNQVIEETNENGHTTKTSYNVYGKPTQIIHPDGSKEQFSYYANGWLKKKLHADGTSITYSYDAKGHLLKEAFRDQEGNHIKEETYHYKGARLISKEDNLGLITTYEYDRAGRKIKETIGGIKTIHYSYDGFSRLVKKEEGERVEEIAYDGLDRPIAKTLKDRQNQLFATEEYEYDIHGNQSKRTVWQTEETAAVTKLQYNSDGTLQFQEDPLQHKTGWEYRHDFPNALGQNIQLRIIRDPLGRVTKETDDAHSRLAARIIYDGEEVASSTQYFYDAAGNLTKEIARVIAAPYQFVREYAVHRRYNCRGLLESETEWPGGKTTTYTYDSMKRLIKKVKPVQVELHYTYTPLGKIETLISSDHTIHYTYSYDTHGNLKEVEDHVQGFTQRRRFDLLDRLEWEDLSPGLRISYTYDAHDRPLTLTLPDSSKVHYFYDAYRCTTLQRVDAAGQLLYEVTCESDLQGNIIHSKSLAGAISTHYDLLNRADSIQAPQWEASLDHFDAQGNLHKKTITDPTGRLEEQFAYDRLNHLTFESSFANRFAYDSLSNCLTKNTQDWTTNTLNQLTATPTATYVYDLNGNLKNESNPSITYEYDALNRLVSLERNHVKTHFSYDALNRCTQVKDPSGTKNLLYQGNQEIGSILNDKLHEFRLVHPEQDRTLAIELADKPFFAIQDAHHNICALQKPDGTLAQWVRYSAFGDQTLSGDPHLNNPWRYANRREISGLILFTHRFYNPRLMRWQTPDPLGFEDGLNLYHYVHHNPFLYRDRDGSYAIAIPIVIELVEITIGALATLTVAILPNLGSAAALALVGAGGYYLMNMEDSKQREADDSKPKNIELNDDRKGRKRGRDNGIRGGPARDPKTANYLPDPTAEGAHTTLGVRQGDNGNYTQGATFDAKGEFKGRTDVTDHGRADHPSPHYHPAVGPNSVKTGPHPLPEII